MKNAASAILPFAGNPGNLTSGDGVGTPLTSDQGLSRTRTSDSRALWGPKARRTEGTCASRNRRTGTAGCCRGSAFRSPGICRSEQQRRQLAFRHLSRRRRGTRRTPLGRPDSESSRGHGMPGISWFPGTAGTCQYRRMTDIRRTCTFRSRDKRSRGRPHNAR